MFNVGDVVVLKGLKRFFVNDSNDCYDVSVNMSVFATNDTLKVARCCWYDVDDHLQEKEIPFQCLAKIKKGEDSLN